PLSGTGRTSRRSYYRHPAHPGQREIDASGGFFRGQPPRVAVTALESLSKTQARQFAKALARRNGLPWTIVIIIDSTLQHRASVHPENAKTFNHGKGYVIGHQWTNIVLLLGDILIPLRPIPFYSKRYCQTHRLVYQSEHEHVVTYLRTLDLEDSIGSYDRREVLV